MFVPLKDIIYQPNVKFLPDKNTINLLRIPFSFFLMPLFILAFSQANAPDLLSSCYAFLIIHLLVYPASNGYNSYVDKDETSIGGLEKPPIPTKGLFYLTLVMDVLAILLSFLLINSLFSLCILIYILASRAYSSKQVRLKKYPFIGFIIVTIFQGAFTFYMCSVGIATTFNFNFLNGILFLSCSLQIAGVYPLTQIYQHKEDLADGVITLSYKLGYKGTFIFTACMFTLCNIFYYIYFKESNKLNQFIILQLFFIPVIIYFFYWFLKVLKDTSAANFKNTMRMNTIAALCMNVCFTLLCLINYLP